MKKVFSGFFATILLLGAVVGIVLALTGILWTWDFLPKGARQADSLLSWVEDTLDTTRAALVVADDSIKVTKNNLAQVQLVINDTSLMLGDAARLAQDTGVAVKNSASIIEDTRTSLDSVRSGMKMVDSMLRVVSSIPFIGGDYAPRESLDESFQRVSDSLVGLPSSFQAVQKDLQSTSADLELLKKDLNYLTGQLKEIDVNLIAVRVVLQDYSRLVISAQSFVIDLRTELPAYLIALAWLVTAFCAWLLVAQISLVIQALYLWRSVFHGRSGTNQ
jgi:hypothetical protein